MNTAQLLVRALEHEGVTHIFGIPGEENLDFLEALRTSSIQLVLTRHEQAAGFMAATYGRLTGKAGVCLSTLGPGATNLVTAAAYAQLGAMPLLMITGQKPIKKSKQGHFQIIDVVEMMKPITKRANRITSGAQVAGLVREAFKCAEDERPGAVHLELPEDIAAEEVADTFLFPRDKVRRPVPDDKAVHLAVRRIEAAKHPVILVGAGTNRKQVRKMLVQLLERTGVPYVDTQMGKGLDASVHHLHLGTAALSANDYVHCALEKADLIINIGHDVVEKPPFLMHPEGPEVIHINFMPAAVDAVYFPQLEVVGDIGNTLWRLSEELTPQGHWDFSYFHRVREAALQQLHEQDEAASFPLLPQRLVADTRKVMPEDGIVCLDNGMYKLWFARQYQCFGHNTLLLDNALATMGAGLPSAMAAKMVAPEKKVVAICGDGGFMMNSQELETAVRMQQDLTVIVLRDNGYGMISWKQESSHMTDFGLRFGNPDFVAYAESYGAHGHRVGATEEFAPLLAECLATPGVHLIEVPVDYSENVRVLTEGLQQKTCLL